MSRQMKKILIISDTTEKSQKIYLDPVPKLAKGFIRLGCDVRQLNYAGILSQLSPFKSRSLTMKFFKSKADKLICLYTKQYRPHIIFVATRKADKSTIQMLRDTVSEAVFIGMDGDPWPGSVPGRIETACYLDILMATNDGCFLDDYRKAGVKKCVFMPNLCDPDIEYRYPVGEKWKTDILWTGKVQHKAGLNADDTMRQDVIQLLAEDPRVNLYGCLGRPEVEGLDYLHAISGARIGISVNAINSIPLYHSDRFTYYTACGTMVLAKRVPETERLMEDKKHVVYFDTPQECAELANWYLTHESERKKIADRGMERCHACFNPVAMTGYMLELMETGQYTAPWGVFS